MRTHSRAKAVKSKPVMPPVKFKAAVKITQAEPALKPGYTILRPSVAGDPGFDLTVPKVLIRNSDGTEQYIPVSKLPAVH